jgi:hypothetical protein
MKRLIGAALVLALGVSGAAMAQDAAKARTDKGRMRLFQGANFSMDEYEVKGARTSIDFEYPVVSIAVYPGEKWEVCNAKVFKGECMIVDKDVTNLGGLTILSARPVKE